MNILITNDDGVGALQLLPLIQWCRKMGEVTVVVPKYEQSAKSHSIEIRSAFEIRQLLLDEQTPVWTVDSTPADCVRFAVSGLKQQFDLVISGINRGYNLGHDVMYSGTLAGASEAVAKGIPAVALSTSIKYYEKASRHLDDIFDFLRHNRIFQMGSLFNINIPVDPIGFQITRQGGLSFREEFIPVGKDLYFPGGMPLHTDGSDITRDTDAVAQGYISITPMTTDRTDLKLLEELRLLKIT